MKRYRGPFFKPGTEKQLLNSENSLQKTALSLNLLVLVGVAYLLAKFFGREFSPLLSDEFLVMGAGIVFLLANGVLITRMRGIGRQIEMMGTDELTGVYNRHAFEGVMQKEIRRASRYHFPLTLSLLDLDNFKSFNDHFGNTRGDELLSAFAQLMRCAMRSADYIGRYDNDEFCVLLPHTDVVQAQKFLSRVLAQSQAQLDCAFSAGLTFYHVGETRAQFLIRARLAIEQAKREGGKKIRCIIGDGEGRSSLDL